MIAVQSFSEKCWHNDKIIELEYSAKVMQGDLLYMSFVDIERIQS